MNAGRWIESLGQDIQHGVRRLRKNPGFAAAAIALLALGVGANTAVFSLVRAAALRPLPFPEPDRLVLLWDDLSARRGPARIEPTPADYVAWKEQSRSFTGMAAFFPTSYNLTGIGEPEKLSAVRATGTLFTVLGMQPILGRTLDQGDERADAAPVVVLSERFWRSRFGGDPNLVGRTINLNGLAHTVVGIVPPDFQFPDKRSVAWVPARFTPEELAQRGTYYFYVVARLKSEVSLAQAQADFDAIGRRLAAQFPQSNRDVATSVTPLHEHLTRQARPTMALLLGAVGLVLLTACANLANLLLARAAAQGKEVALRRILGASHTRLTRQLFVESAVLVAIGATLGVAVSAATFTYLSRLLPDSIPGTTTVRLDASVLLFTLVVAALIVIATGAAPAFAAVRTGLDTALRAAGGRAATGVGGRIRSLLVVAELTMTVVLLAAAGLLLRSYRNVLAVDPGFTPRHVLLAETVLPSSKYNALSNRTRFYDDVMQRVAELPGVTAVAYANYPPLTFKGGRVLISIEGRPDPAPLEISQFVVLDRVVSTGYFATLQVPVVRGREFDRRDGTGAPYAAVINGALARRHWPNENPVGRRLKLGRRGGIAPWLTIVGVVGDVRQMGLDSPIEPEVYLPADQIDANAPFFWPQHLLVRTAGDPIALANGVRRAVWAVDRDQPISNLRSMEEVFDAELQNRNTQLTLVGTFAVLALLIASIGLYAVLSYSVARQLREIGVRMALGARRITVVTGIVRHALSLAAAGIICGTAVAFAGTRLLASWLFNVGATDPSTFAGTALLLVLMALVATAVPAFRGASVDPSAVLRAE